jgi:hypothetical protein
MTERPAETEQQHLDRETLASDAVAAVLPA